MTPKVKVPLFVRLLLILAFAGLVVSIIVAQDAEATEDPTPTQEILLQTQEAVVTQEAVASQEVIVIAPTEAVPEATAVPTAVATQTTGDNGSGGGGGGESTVPTSFAWGSLIIVGLVALLGFVLHIVATWITDVRSKASRGDETALRELRTFNVAKEYFPSKAFIAGLFRLKDAADNTPLPFEIDNALIDTTLENAAKIYGVSLPELRTMAGLPPLMPNPPAVG